MNELVTLPSQFAKFIRYLNIWLKVLNSLDSLTLSPSYSISRNFFSIWATSTPSLRIILSPPRKTRIPKVIPKENRYIYIICPYTLFIFNHTKIKIVPLIILWWEQIDLHLKSFWICACWWCNLVYQYTYRDLKGIGHWQKINFDITPESNQEFNIFSNLAVWLLFTIFILKKNHPEISRTKIQK